MKGRAWSQARIDAWNQLKGCELPIYEPGLEEVVQAARGRNLFFSSDTHKHVAEGDIIFVRCRPPTWLPAAPGCAGMALAVRSLAVLVRVPSVHRYR